MILPVWWLIFWLAYGTPRIFGSSWIVGLVVCVIIELLNILGKVTRAHAHD